jgi:DNA-binding transcriptional ArsR family regulator
LVVESVADEKEEWLRKRIEECQNVVFVPSAHIGPYVLTVENDDALWVMFGARLPVGIQFDAPDLSRAEIVTQLNALADDTRLQILKLISDKGELRSQEVMKALDLSQSAASRHLKQLCATGYLRARRCNGAKCYRFNPERVSDTLHSLSNFFLLGE